MDVKLLNVGLLGLAFLLIFTAFQTIGNIQTTILNSAANNASGGYVEGFSGNGYTSLAIIYLVCSLANWMAPSGLALLGPKWSMVAAAVTYLLFILQLIYPNNYLLYGGSALLGLGAGLLWTAQGNFLTINSSPDTISRNSGIFWGMLQCSLLVGNTFAFFMFQDKSDVDTHLRTVIVIVLSSVCGAGVLVLLLLRPAPPPDGQVQARPVESEGPIRALRSAMALFVTKQMLLLVLTFAYTGFVLTFWGGVYGTSIANTRDFGVQAKSLMTLHGIVVGVGEIIGGGLFGILGHMTNKRGRDPIVVLGFVVHMAAFFLTFINLPDQAPIQATEQHAYVTSSSHLALLTSFLLGLGDACFNTQIYSILGGVFRYQSAEAFAIFKFTQSVAAALGFFYSLYISLYFQLLILALFCLLGSAAFCWVEWNSVEPKLQSDPDDEEPHAESVES